MDMDSHRIECEMVFIWNKMDTLPLLLLLRLLLFLLLLLMLLFGAIHLHIISYSVSLYGRYDLNKSLNINHISFDSEIGIFFTVHFVYALQPNDMIFACSFFGGRVLFERKKKLGHCLCYCSHHDQFINGAEYDIYFILL